MLMDGKRREFIGSILEDVEQEMDDEEIIHLLLDRKLSSKEASCPEDGIGGKMADALARFAGSWLFIGIFLAVLAFWMIMNIVFLSNKGFDPYPFILLNLVLSCVSAVQAPLIMMSQNRQEQKDRIRSENDYRVNLKSEIIMCDLHKKIDRMLLEHEYILQKLGQENIEKQKEILSGQQDGNKNKKT